MKTALLFILFATSITGSYAQSAPAKAPPRKPTPKKSASSATTQSGTAKPSTALPNKPAPTITPAANRSNSEQLPEATRSKEDE